MKKMLVRAIAVLLIVMTFGLLAFSYGARHLFDRGCVGERAGGLFVGGLLFLTIGVVILFNLSSLLNMRGGEFNLHSELSRMYSLLKRIVAWHKRNWFAMLLFYFILWQLIDNFNNGLLGEKIRGSILWCGGKES